MPRVAPIAMFWCALAAGGPAATPAPAQEPAVLTLDEAVSLALQHNRSLLVAVLETGKAEDHLAASRTRMLPVTDLTVAGSRLLTDVGFEFSEGAFGTFPGIGPVPDTDVELESDSDFTTLINASIMQPITQLYSARLGVRLSQAGQALAGESLRAERLSLVAQVRRAYYNLVQSEAAARAAGESVAFHQELSRIVEERVARQAALTADSLDARARLAQGEYDALSSRNSLATQKEQLNDLMGRELEIDFRVEPMPPPSDYERDLARAKESALLHRPELKQARLKVEQAELDQRLKKAELIPDLSIGYSYLTNLNIEVLPKDISSIRVFLSWEPLDWGRRSREASEKQRTAEQARLSARSLENQVLIEVASLHRALEENRLLVQAAEAALQAQTERARVTMDLYRRDAALLSDTLQARAALADAVRGHQQALASFWSARAELERAVGEEVP